MDRAYCERLAKEALAHWVEELPLEDWIIALKIENLEDSDATVDLMTEYRSATIRVDDDKHGGQKKVGASVKHEMMHILTGPDKYREIVENNIEVGRRNFSFDVLRAHLKDALSWAQSLKA